MPPEDLIIETGESLEGQEDSEFEETLTSNISNLAGALNSLNEIDGGLMNKTRQAKFARMKRIIFDTLVYYVECLPQIEDDSN